MKFWGGRTPPNWLREIANDRPRPLVVADDTPRVNPAIGDLVLKPLIDHKSYKQLFRLETLNTHALLDGPFDDIHHAMEAALELGVTARLSVWLDYSDCPESHDLDNIPLYYSDPAGNPPTIP